MKKRLRNQRLISRLSLQLVSLTSSLLKVGASFSLLRACDILEQQSLLLVIIGRDQVDCLPFLCMNQSWYYVVLLTFPILEYWIDPSRCCNVDTACLVHVHLLYLFKNYTYEELDKHALSVLLSSQVYLMIKHRFSSQLTDPTKPPPSIQNLLVRGVDVSTFMDSMVDVNLMDDCAKELAD